MKIIIIKNIESKTKRFEVHKIKLKQITIKKKNSRTKITF